MTADTTERIAIWRDERFWKIVFQVIVLASVIGLIALLIHNMNVNLQKTNREFDFGFLRFSASFNIGETIIPYSPSDSFRYAFLVGLLNTVRVIIPGFILTTLLGVFVGVASFSDNWLVRKLSLVYVEVIRNIPLLLQLIFWYFAVFLNLPRVKDQLQLPLSVFMSKAGISIPWPELSQGFWGWCGVLFVGAIAAWLIWRWRTLVIVEKGQSGQPQLMILLGMAIASLAIFFFGFNWVFPSLLIDQVTQEPDTTRTAVGGLKLSLEYTTLLTGLVVYTAAFIAEIVRSGIQSVSKGQWEAAGSLGLKSGLVMQLVVLPQALRVIIPPLNSQYMNLAKNSSLALVIGYPDLYSVNSTIFNQTGKPVEVFTMIMFTYLAISLTISIVMNWINKAVELQTR
ncbi:MAG: ABC transporter permease subunit [Cyanobacteria bacterium P01_F01_bin.150]